jgi:hypothetical protein
MKHNESVFAMAGYSVFPRFIGAGCHAGTEVDCCFIVEDTFCRLIINVKPELKLIKGLLLIVSMSSPAIANTFVVRSWLSLPGHKPQKKRSNNSFFQISHFKIFCPIKQRTKVCCALAPENRDRSYGRSINFMSHSFAFKKCRPIQVSTVYFFLVREVLRCCT